MLRQVGVIAATLALFATSTTAVPLKRGQTLSPRLATSLTAAAAAIAGDSSCPAVEPDGTITGRVFVAVTVHEIATLSINSDLATDLGLSPSTGHLLSDAGDLLDFAFDKQRRGFFLGAGDILSGMTSSTSPEGTEFVDTNVQTQQKPVTVAASAQSALSTTLDLDLQVCLCLDAKVKVADIQVASLNAEAVAQAKLAAEAAVQASATANAALTTLVGLFGTTGLVNVNANLTPTSGTVCGQCPVTQYPTCTGGMCGCADCDAGKIYQASTGTCVLSPSAGSKSGSPAKRLVGRSLPGSWTPGQIKSKQAKREDIVKRLASKPSKKTV